MKKIILSLISLSMIFVSCKKDKDKKNCSFTQTAVAGTYKLTSVKVNGQEVLELFLSDCEMDDLFLLNANGTYLQQEAAVKCPDGHDEEGNWHITGDEIFLDFIDNAGFKVTNYACKDIIAAKSDPDGDQTGYTLTRQ